VCAGGRYDGLVAQLGGAATPGIGWAMGQERIVMLLEKQSLAIPAEQPQVYMVLVGERAEIEGLKLAERWRDERPGLRFKVNLGGGSFKTQFKRADKSGAELAIVLGDDELERGCAVIKPLRRETPQEDCPIAQVSERMGVLLGL
jgi:histidyl-tRNA synthetase